MYTLQRMRMVDVYTEYRDHYPDREEWPEKPR